jgi:hypothetical protein
MSKLWRHGPATGVRVTEGKWTVVTRAEEGAAAWTDGAAYDLVNALGETGVVGPLDRIDVTRDGKRAAFTVSYGDAQFVQVVDTESGATVRMIGVGTKFTESNFGDVRLSADGRVLVCTYPYAEDATVNRVMVRLAADDFMTTYADVTANDVGCAAGTTLFGARLAIVPHASTANAYVVSALSLEPRRIVNFKIELDASDANVLGAPAAFGAALAPPARATEQWGLLGVEVSSDANALVVASTNGVDVFDVHTARLVQTSAAKIADANDVVASCENGRVTVSVGARVLHSATSVRSAAEATAAAAKLEADNYVAVQQRRALGQRLEEQRLQRVRAASPERSYSSREVQRLRAVSPTRVTTPAANSHFYTTARGVQQQRMMQQRSAAAAQTRVVVVRARATPTTTMTTPAARDGRSYANVARPATVTSRSGLRVRALSPPRATK